ncbi:ribosome biogenesis GTPase A [Ferrimonas sediminum]|uniref:Ribosome biogenesis GTPase A n=1 Tax=Ferrimonas sediminum TaxID=718193 RepID=A0A1G8N5T2_9GAMM|nr:ribosome biogenesis GTPase YlqF [Ferrimonas sediminum]SDI74910.1 ribosome biogenesis GTPase A [Ferrimonas sediminum]
MAINWFPGHMHKARKEIAELMPQIDLIIEVLDARIPFSSENPLVPKLRGDTPCIKILNKSDLADPELTLRWQAYLEQENGVKTIALTQKNKAQVRSLLDLCKTTVPKTPLRTLILGIPNVGKSTLINTLAGRTIAKTGNEPAVTKAQQRIRLPEHIVLHDTPGFLWPKLSPAACGFRLATTGAIKDTVVEYEEVALFAADYLRTAYPDQLCQRYNLDELPHDDIAVLDAIAAKRGCMRRGGVADLHKVSEILLHELRAGSLGPLTLETPEMVEKEQAEELIRAEQEAIEKEKKEELRQAKKRKRRK